MGASSINSLTQFRCASRTKGLQRHPPGTCLPVCNIHRKHDCTALHLHMYGSRFSGPLCTSEPQRVAAPRAGSKSNVNGSGDSKGPRWVRTALGNTCPSKRRQMASTGRSTIAAPGTQNECVPGISQRVRLLTAGALNVGGALPISLKATRAGRDAPLAEHMAARILNAGNDDSP